MPRNVRRAAVGDDAALGAIDEATWSSSVSPAQVPLPGRAVEEARRRGCRKLRVRVLVTNAAARALYDAAGFVVEGVLREEFRIDGAFVDDLLMARRLTEDSLPE